MAGQFLVGAFAAAVTGASLASAPTLIAMPLAMLAGAAGGAAYGFIPGYLKARTGAHEVVTTIMLNNAAVLLLTWAVNDLVRAPGFSFPRTGEIGQSALPILLGRNLHLGIIFAIATIFVIRWIRCTTLASRYAPSARTPAPPGTPACGPYSSPRSP